MCALKYSQISESIGAELLGRDSDLPGISTDTRTIRQGDLFLALQGENFDGHAFVDNALAKGAAGLIVNKEKIPEVTDQSLPILRVEDTLEAYGKIAALHRQQFKIPVIGVTGSCGKTTTKELIAAILQQSGNVLYNQGNFNNEVGIPQTVLQLAEEHYSAVLEMAARHAKDIEYLMKIVQPNIAVVTCVAPCHLETFGDIDTIAATKGEIYSNLAADGTAIINVDDPYAPFWMSQLTLQKVITFGLENVADITCSYLIEEDNATDMEIITDIGTIQIKLPLIGLHNVSNALAAIACVRAMGINLEQIKLGLESYRPVAHRMQILPTSQGATILDDCYNASPVAMLAALNVLKKRSETNKILVAADMLELGSASIDMHAEVGRQAKKLGINKIYAYGPLSRHLCNAFGAGATHCTDRASLTAAVKQELKENTALLVKGSNSMKLTEVVEDLIK